MRKVTFYLNESILFKGNTHITIESNLQFNILELNYLVEVPFYTNYSSFFINECKNKDIFYLCLCEYIHLTID